MTEKETVDQLVRDALFEDIEKEAFIHLDEELPTPEIAISFGEHEYWKKQNNKWKLLKSPTPLVTYGNFIFIQAGPKKGKSFFMTLLASVMLSSTGTNKYAGKLKGHSRGGKFIYIDTEQGKWHAQKAVARGADLNSIEDINLELYEPYALRRYNSQTRLDWIDWKLQKMKDNGEKIDVVFIDGVADLIQSINDESQASMIGDKLLEWSDKHNCAIVTVIHTNPNSEKAVGHIGSQLGKKTENTLHLEILEDGTRELKSIFPRNKEIEHPIQFRINKGIPYILGAEIETISF